MSTTWETAKQLQALVAVIVADHADSDDLAAQQRVGWLLQLAQQFVAYLVDQLEEGK